MQQTKWLSVRGLDPLLLRDGRPFSQEEGANAARSLTLPLPSTLAGFVRTQAGTARGLEWDVAGAEWARRQAVHGPLLQCGGEAYIPAPRDALIVAADRRGAPALAMALRPWAGMGESSGCDLPGGLLPLQGGCDVKPATGYEFWPLAHLMRWLADAECNTHEAPPKCAGLGRELRFHTAMDAGLMRSSGQRGVESGRLFSVEMAAFDTGRGLEAREWSVLARVSEDLLLDAVGFLGGERRMAYLCEAENRCHLEPASVLREKVVGARRLRMQLATPALFESGWRPNWLNAETLEGSFHGLRLKLVAAAIGRREAVSGWDFQTNGSKPVRWMVPAGSVYFFACLDGDSSTVLEHWLKPISDMDDDCNSGFGLALWGVW